MMLRPPRPTRTYTLVPYTTLFRSCPLRRHQGGCRSADHRARQGSGVLWHPDQRGRARHGAYRHPCRCRRTRSARPGGIAHPERQGRCAGRDRSRRALAALRRSVLRECYRVADLGGTLGGNVRSDEEHVTDASPLAGKSPLSAFPSEPLRKAPNEAVIPRSRYLSPAPASGAMRTAARAVPVFRNQAASVARMPPAASMVNAQPHWLGRAPGGLVRSRIQPNARGDNAPAPKPRMERRARRRPSWPAGTASAMAVDSTPESPSAANP